MKMRGLLLSKWFYYGLIGLVLLLFLFAFLPPALKGNDMAANFISEIWGLLFTLAIFFALLELRELVEWKSVEDRVRRRIGKQMYSIFVELSNLCEVDRVLVGERLYDDDARKELNKKQLDSLASGRVQLNDSVEKLWSQRHLASSFASFIESKRVYLSDIEGKYFKFFDSQVRASLMDIQDYLHGLNTELRIRRVREEDFYKSISDFIGKIMKEIVQIRQRKIDIGF